VCVADAVTIMTPTAAQVTKNVAGLESPGHDVH